MSKTFGSFSVNNSSFFFSTDLHVSNVRDPETHVFINCLSVLFVLLKMYGFFHIILAIFVICFSNIHQVLVKFNNIPSKGNSIIVICEPFFIILSLERVRSYSQN